ncbi:uncharacterized protein LOC114280893 [Camellia sinensis]|uniref:uncharacterized protein LOC114280893 n=1 Tax=Camellia sinensis TaxID=4442 RepID=UPI0010362923|nr:uncharacterized protein LOC114280893 [Camellia sinensis]
MKREIKCLSKLTPMKRQMRFDKKGKLTPRYIGPFQILERLGPVVYHITLSPGMEQMHNVFHVSMLRGYLRDPFHVIDHHRITLDKNMIYEEWPMKIIDQQVKKLRNKTIPMVKVEWKDHYGKRPLGKMMMRCGNDIRTCFRLKET